MVTNEVYVGRTQGSLVTALSLHRGIAKQGRKMGLYDAMRKYAADKFTISQIGSDIPIPPNASAMAHLKSFQDRECQHYLEKGAKLFNVDTGTEECSKAIHEKQRMQRSPSFRKKKSRRSECRQKNKTKSRHESGWN